MEEKLKIAIEKFQKATTSLEAYQAIADFVALIVTVPEFIKQIEEEGEKIAIARAEIGVDKGFDHLGGAELRRHNEIRAQRDEALFQLDLSFPLRNLRHIHEGIQPENIVKQSFWLFAQCKPDEPFPEARRVEYQGFIDKLYKKVLPLISKEESREMKKLDFDSQNSELFIQGKKVRISMKNDKTNAHYVLQHIFSDPNRLVETHFYSEMAEDSVISDSRNQRDSWKRYYRACTSINEKALKQAGFEDFLIITTGRSGAARINELYLK